ncbi:MAG: Uracil-DNA glycosylase, family 3 [Myxococcaceae bacterium]|nr:Uracil-DNA glycosylase, family 3 [Myxococcaceae bacterium]
MSPAGKLLAHSDTLCRALSTLRFGGQVAYVYNPLEYARAPYKLYLERYGNSKKRVVFMGMNPGPYGMTQTGVPFGEIAHVRDWMGISAAVDKPAREHPKRPVLGFQCTRSEVSGARLWGMWKALAGTPEQFFSWGFVANYCPLVFMDEGGRNITPDKLAPRERAALFGPCDAHLRAVVATLAPEWIGAVGKFAEGRAREAIPGARVLSMPHPSPANPSANRDWAGAARKQLESQGLPLAELLSHSRPATAGAGSTR